MQNQEHNSLPRKVLDSYKSKAVSNEIVNMNNAIKYTDFCKLSTLKVKIILLIIKFNKRKIEEKGSICFYLIDRVGDFGQSGVIDNTRI